MSDASKRGRDSDWDLIETLADEATTSGEAELGKSFYIEHGKKLPDDVTSLELWAATKVTMTKYAGKGWTFKGIVKASLSDSEVNAYLTTSSRRMVASRSVRKARIWPLI